MSVDWRDAEAYMTRNADLNQSLFAKRERLCQAQAHDTKMQTAIQRGRIVGLGAQKCDMSLKRKLDTIMMHPPVSVHW